MRTPLPPTKIYLIGEKLRTWRQDAGMSIDRLAAALQYRALELRRSSREYIRRYEKGDIDSQRLDVPFLVIVSDILGHDARELGPDIAALIDVVAATIRPLSGA